MRWALARFQDRENGKPDLVSLHVPTLQKLVSVLCSVSERVPPMMSSTSLAVRRMSEIRDQGPHLRLCDAAGYPYFVAQRMEQYKNIMFAVSRGPTSCFASERNSQEAYLMREMFMPRPQLPPAAKQSVTCRHGARFM